jgi:hypothetical protein
MCTESKCPELNDWREVPVSLIQCTSIELTQQLFSGGDVEKFKENKYFFSYMLHRKKTLFFINNSKEYQGLMTFKGCNKMFKYDNAKV